MAGEKRSQEHENAQHDENIVLVDIEGTTTSISFVKETLFPYIRANLKDYIEKKWDDAEFKEDMEKLMEQAKKDETDKIEGFVAINTENTDEAKASLMKNIIWQMDNDRKTGALKQLQGHIWRDAYNSGAVKGHVYDDVPKALEAWTKNGRKIYIYSSGSVDAQKLLFGNSEHGDLLKYISGYFDTEMGPKQEATSYKNIITKIGCQPSNILFLTDIANEAKAAIESGIASVIVVREGNTPLTADEKSKYTLIETFQDLIFQTVTKRQKLDNSVESEKEEVKKVEESRATVSEPMDTSENAETTHDTEKKVEKETKAMSAAVIDTKQESKPVDDVSTTETKKDTSSMECETTAEAEKSSKEIESEEVCTKKVIDSPAVVPASTTEVETKIEAEVKIPETQVDEKVESKLASTSTSNTEENKTESVDKVNENSKIESKTETDADKIDKVDDKTKEPAKSEDTPKVDEQAEVKESIAKKSEEKVTEEKVPVVEETTQNGDSKSETTESTLKTNVATVVELNGGVKKENTGATAETKESEKTTTIESVKSDVIAEAELTKSEPAKEDEKIVEEVVEKKLNGNAPTTTTTTTTTTTATDKDDVIAEKTHRNGVNEEKKQNGDDESTTDKESIKVKKVVDTIADGAGEPDVVPPVAVVAATS